ncbi:MAG TPA: gamma-glutamylcyclotransferase [Acetobacteraceae bacterium]|nr:gamma-glutamylcyclotransferase [Acetobacteraceae bacterium]
MSEQPSDWRSLITRERLRDGSLLAAVRQRLPAGTVFRSDEEVQADLDAALAKHPSGEDAWLFGYGSLMWNPALHFVERQAGIVRGWHRRYCLWLHAGRGSPENPGLMLALDRGGSCAGVLFRIAAAEARNELLLAWRREMFTDAYNSRWVTVQTKNGPVRAVTFVANRLHDRYAGPLDEQAIAARLGSASGALGTCREYLAETLAALNAIGLRDRALERLQQLIGNQPS